MPRPVARQWSVAEDELLLSALQSMEPCASRYCRTTWNRVVWYVTEQARIQEFSNAAYTEQSVKQRAMFLRPVLMVSRQYAQAARELAQMEWFNQPAETRIGSALPVDPLQTLKLSSQAIRQLRKIGTPKTADISNSPALPVAQYQALPSAQDSPTSIHQATSFTSLKSATSLMAPTNNPGKATLVPRFGTMSQTSAPYTACLIFPSTAAVPYKQVAGQLPSTGFFNATIAINHSASLLAASLLAPRPNTPPAELPKYVKMSNLMIN